MEHAGLRFCLAPFEFPRGPRVGLVSGARVRVEISEIGGLENMVQGE
jgi:hypothetical protein